MQKGTLGKFGINTRKILQLQVQMCTQNESAKNTYLFAESHPVPAIFTEYTGHTESPLISDEQKFGLTNGPFGFPVRMKE